MGCGGFLLAMIIRGLLAFQYFPRTILSGVAVGVVVGLILALVKGDWSLMLTSCVLGFVGGIVFELTIRLMVRIENRRRR